ncbi:MAG: hypothetical protein ABI647_10140 [Gemmatimonadota bacterium]
MKNSHRPSEDGTRALAHLLLQREVERRFRTELEHQIERAKRADFAAILEGAMTLQCLDDERAAAEKRPVEAIGAENGWARSMHIVRAAIASERVFAEQAVRHLVPGALAGGRELEPVGP